MSDPGLSSQPPAEHLISTETRNRMDAHLTIVGVVHTAFGLMGLLGLLLGFFVVLGTGFAMMEFAEAAFWTMLAAAAMLFLAALSLPGIIGGIGLLLRKGWARIVLIIVSLLHLLNIPFGTVLGAYTLWVLLQEDSRQALNA